MTLDDARRAVKRVIVNSGGMPRSQRLQDVFAALDASEGGGPQPPQDLLDDFDTSDMEEYFEAPFCEADRIAEGIFGVVEKVKSPQPPPPSTLDTMTGYYTLYLISGGTVL